MDLPSRSRNSVPKLCSIARSSTQANFDGFWPSSISHYTSLVISPIQIPLQNWCDYNRWMVWALVTSNAILSGVTDIFITCKDQNIRCSWDIEEEGVNEEHPVSSDASRTKAD